MIRKKNEMKDRRNNRKKIEFKYNYEKNIFCETTIEDFEVVTIFLKNHYYLLYFMLIMLYAN